MLTNPLKRRRRFSAPAATKRNPTPSAAHTRARDSEVRPDLSQLRRQGSRQRY